MIYRDIPFKEYQEKANALLKKHGINKKNELPIDPESIIRLEGIDFCPSLQLKRNFGIKGCVVKQNNQLHIFIDDYHYYNEPESCFLTIGEELGHCILHLIDLEKVYTILDWMNIMKENRGKTRFIENQARMFGSNIILPSFILEGFLLDWVNQNLKSIKSFNNFDLEALQGNIAILLEDDLHLSSYIIQIALGRYPDRPINRILTHFPELIRKKKSP